MSPKFIREFQQPRQMKMFFGKFTHESLRIGEIISHSSNDTRSMFIK